MAKYSTNNNNNIYNKTTFCPNSKARPATQNALTDIDKKYINCQTKPKLT